MIIILGIYSLVSKIEKEVYNKNDKSSKGNEDLDEEDDLSNNK